MRHHLHHPTHSPALRRVIIGLLLMAALITVGAINASRAHAGWDFKADPQAWDYRQTTTEDEAGACCTPLTNPRFLYSRACIQNETGWTTYDGAQDVAANRYGGSRDFGPLVSLMLPQTCGSFAGTPSYLTMHLKRYWAADGVCWNLAGARRWDDGLGTYVWSGNVDVNLNTYYTTCGITPRNDVLIARAVSMAIGSTLGCDDFAGGATTSSSTPISYSVMNYQRHDIAYPTQLDTSATANEACLNRRY